MRANKNKLLSGNSNIASYIKKAASYSFIIKIIGLFLGLVLQVFLARVMGVEEFGLYSFVITMTVFISTMTILGLDKSIIRFLPEYTNNKDYNLLSSLIIWSFRKAFFATFLVSVSLFVFGPVLAELATPIEGVLLVLMVVIIVISVPVNYIAGILLAMKMPVLSQFPVLILRPLVILLCLYICFFALDVHLEASDVLVINVFVLVLVLIVNVVVFFKNKKFKIHLVKSEHKYKREWWSTSIGFIAITLCNLIITQTDVIMIGGMLAAKDVALYAVASKVSGLLIFFLASVNTVVAPLISEYYHGDKRKELIQIVNMSSKIITVTTIFSALIIIVFADYILLMFGEEYLIAKDVLIVLCLGHCVNSLVGPVSYIMSMTGYQRYVIKILILSSVINIILNFIFINQYGIIGAAYATAIATIVWNLSMFLVVLNKLNINTTCIRMRRSS